MSSIRLTLLSISEVRLAEDVLCAGDVLDAEDAGFVCALRRLFAEPPVCLPLLTSFIFSSSFCRYPTFILFFLPFREENA